MRTFLANVRFTLRLMRRSPAFYALVLALLTAGIGATTAMFSVAESVLLKPLPYPEADDLTDIFRTHGRAPGEEVSAANFLDWRAQGTTFEQMAAVKAASSSLASEGTLPTSVEVAFVTADFFPIFRLKPLLGRLLEVEDDRPEAPLVAVIGAQLWQTQFGADPGVVGKTVTLNSRPYTVVGVAPRGFAFASSINARVDIWVPYFSRQSAEMIAQELREERGLDTLSVIGRRRHGVSLTEAQAQMSAVAKSGEMAYPQSNAKTGIALVDLHASLVGDQSRWIWLLFGAVGLVFAAISANVASLLLARAQARRGELATRAALGADSRALVLQVVTETTVLFGVGSLAGTALAASLVRELAARLFAATPVEAAVPVHLDGAVLLGAVGLSLLLGAAAGLAPALVTNHVHPASVLQQTSARAGGSKSHATVRAILVVTQIAVAFALLAGSGATAKAFLSLLKTDPGFDRTDLATARIRLPSSTYDKDPKIVRFYDDALGALAALPGVESVAATSTLPMSDSSRGLTMRIEGRPPRRLAKRRSSASI